MQYFFFFHFHFDSFFEEILSFPAACFLTAQFFVLHFHFWNVLMLALVCLLIERFFVFHFYFCFTFFFSVSLIILASTYLLIAYFFVLHFGFWLVAIVFFATTLFLCSLFSCIITSYFLWMPLLFLVGLCLSYLMVEGAHVLPSWILRFPSRSLDLILWSNLFILNNRKLTFSS